MGPPATNMPVDPFHFLHIKIPCYSISEITLNKTWSFKRTLLVVCKRTYFVTNITPHLSSINATHAPYKLILTHNSVKTELHKAKHLSTITSKYLKRTPIACFRFIRNHTTNNNLNTPLQP